MHSSFYNFVRYDVIENDPAEFSKIYWNKNGKLLVIVNSNYQNETLRTLLEKILGAINASEMNTSIVQIDSNHNLKLSEQLAYQNCSAIISLGVTPKELGLNIDLKYFDTFKLRGITCLFSPGLSELNDNNDYKKHLWGCLKEHFSFSKS